MNENKERVYSEEDLCEYTILQKIDELEKQLKNIKNEFNGLYETKEAADAIHRLLRSNDAKINNRVDGLYNITPTDVGVKDNKLGLLHETTWLTNQDAINIGDGLSYDESTKTLKASGGEIKITNVEQDWTANGPDSNIEWASYAVPPKPNTYYNVGDTFKAVYIMQFFPRTLNNNQILVPSIADVNVGNPLTLGDVILAPLAPSVLFTIKTTDSHQYKPSITADITYIVIKAGTTGSTISTPEGVSAKYAWNIYAFA